MGTLPANTSEYCPTSQEHSKDVLYTIKKDPIVGRYMVASRDIQPGENIFSDEPVAVGNSIYIIETYPYICPLKLNNSKINQLIFT